MNSINPENLRVNGSRLWDSLMTLAQIGATPKGGVKRLALTACGWQKLTAAMPDA